MELGTVQKLAEHLRNLSFDDSRAVVFDDDTKAVFPNLAQLDVQGRQDASFLAGIEAVVDGFLDRGQKSARRAVEPQ